MPMFELPTENNKHPNFEWSGEGGVRVVLFSEVTLFEYNVSTTLSPIVGSCEKHPSTARNRIPGGGT